ncbi:manganese transporter SMF1 [Phakopsora pachyrhizi]|nr:manganese transporter SMF1 [Phakopsora pachyrhizi]
MLLRDLKDEHDAACHSINCHVDKVNTDEGIKDFKQDIPKRVPGLFGVMRRHVKYLGPGVVASAAYYDPGNWATDLEAGSRFGNSHLFILVVAVVLAIFLQILASRLGYISRKDIAENCRESLYSRPKNPLLTRWLMFYPLWLLFEIGILFADIGELLGSAIAYTLLFPRIPIYAAVLLTFPEVFLSLIFFRNGKQSKKSMKYFEAMITVVVMAVVVSSLILFFKVKPDAINVLKGYIPSAPLVSGTGFYYAIGIIGATVGPHSLILGSALAKLDAPGNECDDPKDNKELPIHMAYSDMILKGPTHQKSSSMIDKSPIVVLDSFRLQRTVRECKSYLAHSSFDIAASLLTLPLIVNSAILAIASKTYFFGKMPALNFNEEAADIASMHGLLSSSLGQGFGILFAISLLLSALTASLTITIAGQSVSSGFLNVQTSPLIRRLITRTMGIIPSAIISAALGKDGVNKMLIASQVSLSVILPLTMKCQADLVKKTYRFSIIPLAIFTSKQSIMSIVCIDKKSRLSSKEKSSKNTKCLDLSEEEGSESLNGFKKLFKSKTNKIISEKKNLPSLYESQKIEENNEIAIHSFSNHLTVNLLVGILILVVTVANAYGVSQAIKGS